MTRWRLEVMNFPGHPHGYATLQRPRPGERYEGIEVTWALDAATAQRWNDLDPDFSTPQYRDLGYKAGERTKRFQSREAASAAGVALFLEVAEPGDVLVGMWSDQRIAEKRPEKRRNGPAKRGRKVI